ncbi:MAG: methyltransferase domain-containing protein [Anaerolineales bacterium]|nr:methyltransferase domain-containing protein [Anaerolineales bacterium]
MLQTEIDPDIKQRVREFYDSIGWREIGEGVYQNARYEDLRPVVREYIHRCHVRVGRHLPSEGIYLLDGGSGPIQYPEYIEYSRGYRYRVCLDISKRALTEARTRIKGHGLFVVGDIAHLPFKDGTFQGVVSLHTVHHLPPQDHRAAFLEFNRVLQDGGRAVVVHSWKTHSPLRRLSDGPVEIAFKLIRLYRRLRGLEESPRNLPGTEESPETQALLSAPGSYTYSHGYRWMKENLKQLAGLDIRVWRSVSTNFMRAFVHRRFFGRMWLRMLYWLEERAPHFFGRFGQYPMILFEKHLERST